jgi:hypothetical protein
MNTSNAVVVAGSLVGPTKRKTEPARLAGLVPHHTMAAAVAVIIVPIRRGACR